MLGFQIMKNSIKKAPVKFWEDLLYFSAFYADFCFCSKLVIITTLSCGENERTNMIYRILESGRN